jgi:hypothetical protein
VGREVPGRRWIRVAALLVVDWQVTCRKKQKRLGAEELSGRGKVFCPSYFPFPRKIAKRCSEVVQKIFGFDKQKDLRVFEHPEVLPIF